MAVSVVDVRGRRVRPRRLLPAAGYTLVEVLFAASLLALLTAAAVPQVLAGADRSRARAAARYLAARAALARAQAVGRSSTIALAFDTTSAGVRIAAFIDGNRNGVRTREIQSGIDLPVGPAESLSDLFPGVAIGLGEEESGDPVRLSGTHLLSFTPEGTATSGSVYIRGRGGSRFAVRVLGATGRCRVMAFDEATRQWISA